MSALEPDTPELVQLLMNAAAQLSSLDGPRRSLIPAGIPIRRGRLHLGRLRSLLDGHDRPAVVAGFAAAAWIGPPATTPPQLGRLAYRTDPSIDPRGRLLVDFRVRRWLAVSDTLAFEVVF